MKRVFNRLIGTFIPLIVLPSVILFAVSLFVTINILKKTLTDRLDSTLQGVRIEFQNREQDLLYKARQIIGNPLFIENVKTQDRQIILSNLYNIMNEIQVDQINLVSVDGIILAQGDNPTEFGLSVEDHSAYRELQKEEYYSAIDVSDRGLGIKIYIGIEEDMQTIGYLEVLEILDYLTLEDIKSKYNLDSILYDGERLQATTFTDSDILNNPQIEEMRRHALEDEESYTSQLQLAVDSYYISVVEPLFHEDKIIGDLGLFLPSDDIKESTQLLLRIFSLSLIILLSLSLLISWIFSMRLVEPLDMLSDISQRITMGNYGETAQYSSDDELGILAKSFNSMSIKLKQTILLLEEQKKDINREKELSDSLIESLPGIYFLTDHKGNFLRCNKRLEELTQYSSEEILQMNSLDMFTHDKELIAKAMTEALNKGESTVDASLTTQNGTEYLHSFIAVKINIDNRPCIMGTGFDLTELKKAEEELLLAKRKAESSTLAKSLFLANMSHEIRTPMNSVMGFIDLALDSKELPQPIYQYLSTARDSAKILLTLINDILDISKLEAGKIKIEKHPFNLKDLLDETIEPLQILCKERAIDLNYELPPSLNICLMGDSNRLKQVLINLIGNSIKFTPKGHIKLRVGSHGDDFLEFAVEDTGIGMTEEEMSRIFDSFTQADLSTAREYGGTGLGTTICRQLTQLMGGRIWVESTPHVGTTFHFTLPKFEVNPCVEGDSSTGKKSVGTTSQRLNILLAEDMKENALLAKIRIEEGGHTIRIAENGYEALKAYFEEEFDIILMDIHMPGMDGFEACKQIRNHEKSTEKSIPIIALTASVMKEDREMYIKAGMNGVVSKPIDFQELFTVINHFIPNLRNHNLTTMDAEQPIEQWKDIGKVEGIDVDEAQKTWMDINLYLESLETFIQEKPALFEDMLRLIGEKEWTEAHEISHSLKSVSGSLSLTDLHDELKILDEALRNKDEDPILESFERIIGIFKLTMKSISSLIDGL